jgi:hypothetical protein
MAADTRPLHVRVLALARRFEAQAVGAEKLAGRSLQDPQNYRRDAATLFEAAAALTPSDEVTE